MKKSTKPGKVHSPDIAAKPSLRNPSKFHGKPRKVCREKTKVFGFYDKPCRFRRFFILSFDILTHLEAFRHLPNLFGCFREKSLFQSLALTLKKFSCEFQCGCQWVLVNVSGSLKSTFIGRFL